jgi:hypothetical protein
MARIERIKCWFMPMRPVTPFMMMPRRCCAISVLPFIRAPRRPALCHALYG